MNEDLSLLAQKFSSFLLMVRMERHMNFLSLIVAYTAECVSGMIKSYSHYYYYYNSSSRFGLRRNSKVKYTNANKGDSSFGNNYYVHE